MIRKKRTSKIHQQSHTFGADTTFNEEAIKLKKESWRQKIPRLEEEVRRLSESRDRFSTDLDVCRRELDIHREYKAIIQLILRR